MVNASRENSVLENDFDELLSVFEESDNIMEEDLLSLTSEVSIKSFFVLYGCFRFKKILTIQSLFTKITI